MVKAWMVRLLGCALMAAGVSFLPLIAAAQDPAGAAPGTSMALDALEIRDMDINDVLKLLADKSGLNIISGKTVQGRVTIYLKNVDVRDALTVILKANDLAYIQTGGLVQVITSAEYEQMFGRKFGVKTETRIFNLKGLKAKDAAELLEQMKSAGGKIIPDGQSNALMIEDVPEKLVAMARLLDQADVPTATQVYKLEYGSAEALTEKLKDVVTPKIGSVRFDALTNKLFVTDTAEKLKEIDLYVKQVDMSRETKVFKLSYAKAEEMTASITALLSKDSGHMELDKRSNSLVVTDTSPKIKQVAAVIASLDRQEKEVLIEAKIIQVDLSNSNRMGFNWQSILNKQHNLTIDNHSQYALPDALTTGDSGKVAINVGTMGSGDFALVLEAIAQMGKSRILSSPRIAAVNNQEAQILVGTTTPYVTSTTTAASGINTVANTVNFIDTGVKLIVTPIIHDDGYVTMKLKPEVSGSTKTPITVTDGQGNKNSIPVVDKSSVDTTVRVKDGVTIAIGGMIQDINKNDQNRVPILGSIPVLGHLFRSEGRGTDKSEIIIFLTPHIMSGDIQQEMDAYIPDADTRTGNVVRKF